MKGNLGKYQRKIKIIQYDMYSCDYWEQENVEIMNV